MSYDHNGIETIAHYTGGGIGISAEQTSLGYKYLSFGCTDERDLSTTCSLLDAPGVIHAIRLAADAFGECPEMLLQKKEARPRDPKLTMPARRETRVAVATDGTVIIEQDTEDGDVQQLAFSPDDEDAFAAYWHAKCKEAKALRAAAEPKGPQPLAPKLKPGKERP